MHIDPTQIDGVRNKNTRLNIMDLFLSFYPYIYVTIIDDCSFYEDVMRSWSKLVQ